MRERKLFKLTKGPERWSNGIVNYWFVGPDGRDYRLINHDSEPDNIYSSISVESRTNSTKLIAGVQEYLFRIGDVICPQAAYDLISLAMAVFAAGVDQGERDKQFEITKALGL